MLSAPSPATEKSVPEITKKTKPTKNTEPTAVSLTWRSYADAYILKYHGVAPTWNAKVAGQLKQFIARVPENEAPDIAKFYLTHKGAKYIAGGHSIGLLLMDAEKLRTEWLSGRKITSQEIRNSDSGDALKNQLERLAKG